MTEVITIGVDLAKNVFQVHGVDGSGGVVFRRQLRRGQMLSFFKKQPLCLVGMEACATSHHWGREIEALGHQVCQRRSKNRPCGGVKVCRLGWVRSLGEQYLWDLAHGRAPTIKLI